MEDGEAAQSIVAMAGDTVKQAAALAERLGKMQPEGGKPDDREIKTFARNLLASLDGLDRIVEFASKAVETNPELRNWLTSLLALQAKQLKTVEAIGLVPMDCLGSKLDLNLHDVVKTVRNSSVPPETVVEVAQKGYYFRGKLIRDAKVVVAE